MGLQFGYLHYWYSRVFGILQLCTGYLKTYVCTFLVIVKVYLYFLDYFWTI